MKKKQPAKRHYYTSDELLFLKKNYTGGAYSELTKLFNEHFNVSLSKEAIRNVCLHHKLFNNKTGGQNSAIGSEIKYSNGFVYVKVRCRNEGEPPLKTVEKWKRKHTLIWESAHGPMPKDNVIIFADDNKSNFAIDNLIMVSRKEYAVMHNNGLISSNPELNKIALLTARLKIEIAKSERELKERGITA
jgi:hypothetical protein